MLAHGVWLDRDELELIAERGATVVTNPVANLKLASGGPFPYPVAREAGVAVALGTDGAGSNDSLDLLSDLKTFALMQRHAAARSDDPSGAGGARGRNRGPGPDPRRRQAAHGRRPGRLPAAAQRRLRDRPRRPRLRHRLRRQRLGRRHDRRRRQAADAGRPDRRRRGDDRDGLGASGATRNRLIRV